MNIMQTAHQSYIILFDDYVRVRTARVIETFKKKVSMTLALRKQKY